MLQKGSPCLTVCCGRLAALGWWRHLRNDLKVDVKTLQPLARCFAGSGIALPRNSRNISASARPTFGLRCLVVVVGGTTPASFWINGISYIWQRLWRVTLCLRRLVVDVLRGVSTPLADAGGRFGRIVNSPMAVKIIGVWNGRTSNTLLSKGRGAADF